MTLVKLKIDFWSIYANFWKKSAQKLFDVIANQTAAIFSMDRIDIDHLINDYRGRGGLFVLEAQPE